MRELKVLIIDDHPVIASAYVSALKKIAEKDTTYTFTITETVTIDNALQKLGDNPPSYYNLVFLDIKLPKSKDETFLSGEDLGIFIRDKHPDTKIIIATTYNDNYRINSLLKSTNPDGFLIKNDMLPQDLMLGIIEAIENPPHYSKTVQQLIRKHISSDLHLDKIDRQILYELSIGTKMKELPKVIPMSMGGIERRKRQIKDIFEIADQDDRVLIKIAQEKGFI